MNTFRLLGFFAAVLLAAPAAAQTVYRCGNDYGQVACSGGRAIETRDGPTPQQRRDAERVAQAERRQGDDMARDRRQQEAGRRPAAASNLGPAKASAPADRASASIRLKKKARGRMRVVEGEDFVARESKARSNKNGKAKKEKSDPR